MLYFTILYYTILCYTILYYSLLYCSIPYYPREDPRKSIHAQPLQPRKPELVLAGRLSPDCLYSKPGGIDRAQDDLGIFRCCQGSIV